MFPEKNEREIFLEYLSSIFLQKVAKAQIEKAEVKANMAKERMEITKQLAGERERGLNLNETMAVLKHQSCRS